MTRAIAIARSLEWHAHETLRTAIVGGCAFALIAAGRAFPI